MFIATEHEIKEFTQCFTPAAQFEVLKALQIKHFRNLKNKPTVAAVVLQKAKEEQKASKVIPSSKAIYELQSMPRNGMGIYFLCEGEEIVYIGKTTNFFGRLATHNGSEYQFDSVKFLPATEKRLDILEREYIARFHPKYNKAHKPKQETQSEPL